MNNCWEKIFSSQGEFARVLSPGSGLPTESVASSALAVCDAPATFLSFCLRTLGVWHNHLRPQSIRAECRLRVGSFQSLEFDLSQTYL